MMRRCGNDCHGNMVGPCSCGLFRHHGQSNGGGSSAFSMFFSSSSSVPHNNNYRPSAANCYDYETDHNMYSFASSSSSVDCTLSLGTPSTRLTAENEKRNFSWNNIFQSKKPTPPSSAGGNKSGRAAAADSIVTRRCANCDTTSTPLWRNGPRGPKSLCNACGIRFKKEERRATAAAATANGGAGNNSWVHQYSSHAPTAAQKVANCYPSSAYNNEFRFMEDAGGGDSSDTGIPFLSWRLNVADWPAALVHDFTR